MALNNSSINANEKMTKKKSTLNVVRQFLSSQTTIIVDAEFLVLVCASDRHLAHHPAPPALAVNMRNVGAR